MHELTEQHEARVAEQLESRAAKRRDRAPAEPAGSAARPQRKTADKPRVRGAARRERVPAEPAGPAARSQQEPSAPLEQSQTGPAGPAAPIVGRMRALAELRTAGLLTDAELATEKARLLASL